jgi:hypothetical protein
MRLVEGVPSLVRGLAAASIFALAGALTRK